MDPITGAFNGERSMLKKCYWKGRAVDCAAIFTVFPTDRGMCCTFNMHKESQSLFNLWIF